MISSSLWFFGNVLQVISPSPVSRPISLVSWSLIIVSVIEINFVALTSVSLQWSIAQLVYEIIVEILWSSFTNNHHSDKATMAGHNLIWHRPLTRYVKLCVAHAPGMPGTFSPPPTSKETASLRSQHASWHVRHARAVMHVGISNPRWRGKRSRHSRRMRNPRFCVSGKTPMVTRRL